MKGQGRLLIRFLLSLSSSLFLWLFSLSMCIRYVFCGYSLFQCVSDTNVIWFAGVSMVFLHPARWHGTALANLRTVLHHDLLSLCRSLNTQLVTLIIR